MKNPWTKSRHANPTEETETIKTETSLLLHEPMEMTWKKKTTEEFKRMIIRMVKQSAYSRRCK